MFEFGTRRFQLAKVGLMQAGCPEPLTALERNKLPYPIVISNNKEKLGKIEATGYFPKGVIEAGEMTRRRLYENNVPISWAFIEAGVDINPRATMSRGEYLTALDEALTARVSLVQAVGQKHDHHVLRVFPFDGMALVEHKEKVFWQAFAMDAQEKRVALRGAPIAAMGEAAGATSGWGTMPRVQTGLRYAYSTTPAPLGQYTRGAIDSELMTQVVRNWKNIVEAATMYLDYARNAGRSLRAPMKPSFYPTTASWGKMGNALSAQGIDAFDFVKWSASVQDKTTGTKTYGKDEVPMAKHAYVGAKSDQSTWRFPFDTEVRCAASKRDLAADRGLPSAVRVAIAHKLAKGAPKRHLEASAPLTPVLA